MDGGWWMEDDGGWWMEDGVDTCSPERLLDGVGVGLEGVEPPLVGLPLHVVLQRHVSWCGAT